MKSIGITGQAGFIGTHLFNYLSLCNYNLIPFKDSYFDDDLKLDQFCGECDVIVHLAGVNRHFSDDYIFSKNIELTDKLINACERTGKTEHILFSSSTQESNDSVYGSAKKECRDKWINWSKRTNKKFTGMVIPNVFGPYGNPFYNSVVATFSHQILHGEVPEIIVDSQIDLIYVNKLVERINLLILNHDNTHELLIDKQYTVSVSDLLSKLNRFYKSYIQKNSVPDISNQFSLDLFNTFRGYVDLKTFFPVELKINADERGQFTQLIKTGSGGQFSFSTTMPGITRGNHYHTRKVERFMVLSGEAEIKLRKVNSDIVYTYKLSSECPAFVDMPIWYTHNITNVGRNELITAFWINEQYNVNNPDTYWQEV